MAEGKRRVSLMAAAERAYDTQPGAAENEGFMNDAFRRFGVIGSSSVLALLLVAGCRTEPRASESVTQNRGVVAAVPVHVQTAETQAATSPQDALAELRAGNARFVAGKSRARNLPGEVHATAGHQYPFAVIVSCIDSRVPVERVFDQGIGDVFNARVAGNVLNDDIVGSIEYACKVAGAKLIVVLGHSSCGAIKGAVDDVKLGKLTGLLEKIKPAEDQVPQSVQPRSSKNKEFVQQVTERNVRLVVEQIRERSPILREMLDTGKIGLTGGLYDV
ncbi:MAG: carbonic anhydrase family protein, partial [Limisphaerales bacterium]